MADRIRPWAIYRRRHGRLLEPGYAGDPAPEELVIILEKLSQDPELAWAWGFKGAPSPEGVKAVALYGDPVNPGKNAALVATRPKIRPSQALNPQLGPPGMKRPWNTSSHWGWRNE